MANISIDLIKKLREKTQVGMMDCKKALIEADGDFDKAIEALRKKGASVAAKRADNATDNGTIQATIAPDYRSGALVEASCETDFSANTDAMRSFATSVASHVLASSRDTQLKSSADDVATLLQESLHDNQNNTVQHLLDELISKIAESIKVAQFSKITTTNNVVNAYIHPGATLGVLVELEIEGDRPADITKLVQAAKDVAMQAAVTNPLCITPEQIDANLLAKEKEVFADQLRGEGKPEQIIEKILPGKLNKFYETVCLPRQKFIKDEKQSVQDMLDAIGKEAGVTVRVANFVRFAIGG